MTEVLIISLCAVGIVVFIGLFIISISSTKKIDLSKRIVFDTDQLDVDEKIKKLKEDEQYQQDDNSLNIFQKKARELEQSNTGITIVTYYMIMIAVGLAFIFIVYKLLGNLLMALPFSIIGYFIPPLIVNKIRHKKIEEFDKNLIKVMRRLSANMRAGNSLTQAIEDVVKTPSLPMVVRNEFRKVLSDIRVGKTNRTVFNDLYKRTGSKEVQFLAIAIDIQATKGGNLSETFEKVSTLISDKFVKEADVRSTLAQARMTSTVLCILPFVLPAIIYGLSPHYFDPLTVTLGGRFFILGCFGVITFGAIVLKKMSRIEL